MATETGLQNAPVTPARLWFGLAASAAAWVSLGLLDILITWRACVHQEEFGNAVSNPAARGIYISAAAILFLIVLVAGILSYRNWRAISTHGEILNATANDRREFMALLGVFVSITLGMGVVWLAIPPLIIELCVRAK